MTAGSPEHRRWMRKQAQRRLDEIWRGRRLLPVHEREALNTVNKLARDRRRAPEIKRFAYTPPMTTAREYAWCLCQVHLLGNLTEVRRLDRKEERLQPSVI